MIVAQIWRQNDAQTTAPSQALEDLRVTISRAAVYGVAAFGLPGVLRAVGILQGEIEITLKQIGCPSLAKLGLQFLRGAPVPEAASPRV